MRSLIAAIIYFRLLFYSTSQRINCDELQEAYIAYIRRVIRFEYKKCDLQVENYGDDYFPGGVRHDSESDHKLQFHVVCFNK